MPIKEALDRAHEYELDLVEVSPNSRPPVCRILDFGKFKYEQSKKDKSAKKRQHSFQLKEMRYRPKTDQHDYDFKCNHVRDFLISGSKVRVYVMFRGRELAYTDRGRILLERIAGDMADIAVVDMAPKREGRNMSMVLSPTSEVLKQVKTAASVQEAKKQPDAKKSKPPEAVPDIEESATPSKEAE